MNKLKEVIEILNSHFNYIFAYSYNILESGENMLTIFKTDPAKQDSIISIIQIKTFNSEEKLFQHGYEVFIKYIANSKEIFRTIPFKGDTLI